MKIKTSELLGQALDRAVAKCEKVDYIEYVEQGFYSWEATEEIKQFSTNWSQGGPIIEREKIMTKPKFHSAGYKYPEGEWYWVAFILGPNNIDDNFEQEGPTPLIAAMRCYVASKLGDEVEIPGVS